MSYRAAPGRVAIAMVSLMLSCTSASPVPAPSPTVTPIRGGRIVEAITADVRTLQPILSADTTTAKAISLLYEGLVRADARTGAPMPNLGTWQVEADGRTYSWVIAADAAWSDGTPITSQDFVVTIKALARSKAGRAFLRERIQGFSEFKAGSSGSISGIRLDPQDPKRMSVTLVSPVCQAPSAIFASPLIPAHIFGRYVADGMGDAIDRAPENDAPLVASGPFVLEEWRRGERLVLARNERYWQGPSLFAEYELKVVPRANVVAQLRSGAVDVFEAPSPEEALAIEMIAGVQLHRTLDRGFTGIAWDTRGDRVPALRDKRVRQALAHALNWEAVIRVMFREGARNNAHHSPSHWVFTPGLPSYAYDPARAETLLRSAGYERDAAGIFARDGQRIELTMVTNEGNRARETILQLARDQFAAVGVSVTAQRAPFGQLVSRAQSGEAFDGWVIGWTLPPGDADTMQAWHTASIPAAGRRVGVEGAPPSNFARFGTAEIDRALEAFTFGPDCSTKARHEAHATVNRILNEEQPWDFGILQMRYTATPTTLRGFVSSVHYIYEGVHLWWRGPSAERSRVGGDAPLRIS